MRKQSRAKGFTSSCQIANITSPDGFVDHWCTYHGQYVLTCLECGRPFHSARPHTRTCSNACRQRAYRKAQQADQVKA